LIETLDKNLRLNFSSGIVNQDITILRSNVRRRVLLHVKLFCLGF